MLPVSYAETTFYEGDFFSTGNAVFLDLGGTPKTGCTSLWLCEEWSQCSNNLRDRICIDINQCNNEKPPLLLSCSEPIPTDRIIGCVDISNLNILIMGWKIDVYRFDVINSAINHWKFDIQC